MNHNQARVQQLKILKLHEGDWLDILTRRKFNRLPRRTSSRIEWLVNKEIHLLQIVQQLLHLLSKFDHHPIVTLLLGAGPADLLIGTS